jgi:DNA-binding MarR family transcriptional regulator
MKESHRRQKTKIGKVKKNPKLEKILKEYKQVRGRQYRLDGLFRELVAKKTGMSMSEQACLGYLLEKGQATPTDLARITGLTTGAMTGLIARLEKQGCLTSERDTKDKRKVIVRPVEKVAAMPALYYRSLTEKYYQLLSSFNEDQLEFLLYKSRAITKMLEDSIRRMIHENDDEKIEARKKRKQN